MHLTQAEYDTLVTGRKPRRGRKPGGRRKTKAEREREAAELAASLLEVGSVVCEGVVEGQAVSWKAPSLGRNGGRVPTRDYKRYQGWQAEVKRQVAEHMGRRKPYGGPVSLDVTFYLAPVQRNHRPDRSNLLKAFEDALQSVAIANDTQIESGMTSRVFSDKERQRVEYRIVAI